MWIFTATLLNAKECWQIILCLKVINILYTRIQSYDVEEHLSTW